MCVCVSVWEYLFNNHSKYTDMFDLCGLIRAKNNLQRQDQVRDQSQQRADTHEFISKVTRNLNDGIFLNSKFVVLWAVVVAQLVKSSLPLLFESHRPRNKIVDSSLNLDLISERNCE